jgi:hypothetical protein
LVAPLEDHLLVHQSQHLHHGRFIHSGESAYRVDWLSAG